MLAVCMAMIDDEEDKKAFEKLYEKYKNRVYTISYNVLKNKALAEDATSDTFFSLAKNFQNIKNLEHHKLDYFIVITSRNTAIDMLRKEKENMSVVQYNDDLFLCNDCITRYDHAYLKECIKKLTYTEKEILYLRFSCGLEYSDISKTLGIGTSAARKRFQYAKDKLKKLLEQEDI